VIHFTDEAVSALAAVLASTPATVAYAEEAPPVAEPNKEQDLREQERPPGKPGAFRHSRAGPGIRGG
jgi:hypothetical protein